MKTFFKMLMLTTVTLFIYGCSNSSEDDIMEPGDKKITYEANVKSIISTNCTSCHGNPPTNGAPFSLTTYDEVKGRANSILSAMSAGRMPKSGKLPQATINVIDQWIKDGLLEK
ncbi:hypothetical protein UMM65_06200 [Aureibaculum sp. 2210JD6-5]|uniref:hypothetical protein n=1 Tax=Aureibaculum sp. 2210JD6-5 TaxID=3103957 RepID=UPI002AAE0A33|nr:hypothetical protein [Aureibaculum sp. 2210JD6-5]MDY7394825.1 hypothetical protein [Aureibaculum sp. 2210JD6-5]